MGQPITVSVEGPVNVIGDPNRLRQMVDNMLENAHVHTPAAAPVAIQVGIRDRMAVLAVIDTGPGIDPDQARHVFERFYRATPPGSGDSGSRTVGSTSISWKPT